MTSKSIRNIEVKDLLVKLLTYFEREKNQQRTWFMNNPIKRLANATGLNEKIIRRHTSNSSCQDVVRSIHAGVTKKPVNELKKLDDFDEGVVRRSIHDLYRKSEMVTMPKLHSVLKKKDIHVSLTTVKRTVKRLGFRYAKKGSNRRFVVERQDIVSWRHTYLRTVRKFRQEGRHIVYLDETWLNTNHVVKGDWLDQPSTSLSVLEPSSRAGGRVIPSGKGTRLIILDAGSSQQGLIPGCGLIFESKTGSSDYHDEMNKEHFTEWFKENLIPKLLPQSVIVMDNAPYHSHLVPDSKVPNTGNRKSEISAWLDRNNIHYPPTSIKAELLDLVKQNKPRPRYVIDELASEYGHQVLRLPPRHCELNPIEMVWSDLKGYVARNNSTYKKKDVKLLFEQAKSRFSAERWANFETHVVKEVEEKLWLVDGIRDEEISPFIIDTTEEDSDFDTDDEFDEGEDNDVQNDCDMEIESSDDTDSSDVSKPCKVCHAAEPPNLKKTDKEITWYQCEYCGGWLHEKCCTGAARKKDMCPRCHSILHHRDLNLQLVSEPMDIET